MARRSCSQVQAFSLPWLLLQTKYGANTRLIDTKGHPIPKAVSTGQNRKIVAKQLENSKVPNVNNK